MNRVTDVSFAKILFRDAVEEYPKHKWHEGYELNPHFELLKVTDNGCVATTVEDLEKEYAAASTARGELCRVHLKTSQGQVYKFRTFKGDDGKWYVAPFCIGNEDFFNQLKNAWLKIAKNRQYSSVAFYKHAIDEGKYDEMPTMKKTWNRGMGKLEIWRIDHAKREILVNTALFNICDRRHIRWLINEVPELKEYSVFGTSFGYPLYYNHSFGTELGGKEKITI